MTDTLLEYFSTQGYMLGRPQNPCISPDGKTIYFLRTGFESKILSLHEWNINTKKSREILHPHDLIEKQTEELSQEEKSRRERLRLTAQGFTSFEISPDGNSILLPFSGKIFIWNPITQTVKQLPQGNHPAIDAHFSPNGQYIAYVRGKDLYTFHLQTEQEFKLTNSSHPCISYGLPDFIAQEEMHRFSGFFWAPDSQSLAVCEVNNQGVETFFITDPSVPEKPPLSFPYPRPGKNNACVRLAVVSVVGGPLTFVTWDEKQFPYLATVCWQEQLALVVQDRRQKQLRLLEANPQTGETQTLLEEYDPAWLNLFQEVPYFLKRRNGFLWVQESNGRPELILYEDETKQKKNLLSIEYGYRRLLAVNEEAQVAYVAASPHPSEQHLYQISLVTGVITKLTDRNGIHQGVFGATCWVHTESTLTSMPRSYIRDFTNQVIGELPHFAKEPSFIPQVEIRKVGELQFQTVITRPKEFQKNKKYPVLLDVYGGPMHIDVIHSMRRYLLNQLIANEGFIVISIDGRGTPWRGRDWDRAILGDFSSVPLEDQVTGLQELIKLYPEMDQNKICVNGWSFGGYMAALAILKRPDIFQVAVAGAPVVDWRDYDTHYTERYLGLPEENPIGYQNSSLLSYVDKLEKPLLILHGTADDNVYFFNSLKLSQALFNAGKSHAFIPLSGVTHMIGDPIINQKKWETILSFMKKALSLV